MERACHTSAFCRAGKRGRTLEGALGIELAEFRTQGPCSLLRCALASNYKHAVPHTPKFGAVARSLHVTADSERSHSQNTRAETTSSSYRYSHTTCEQLLRIASPPKAPREENRRSTNTVHTRLSLLLLCDKQPPPNRLTATNRGVITGATWNLPKVALLEMHRPAPTSLRYVGQAKNWHCWLSPAVNRRVRRQAGDAFGVKNLLGAAPFVDIFPDS